MRGFGEHAIDERSSRKFIRLRHNTPQLAAGSFILIKTFSGALAIYRPKVSRYADDR
jgi:hypothetical protein